MKAARIVEFPSSMEIQATLDRDGECFIELVRVSCETYRAAITSAKLIAKYGIKCEP